MALREEMREQGDWFFRWRSYLPLLLVPLLLVALKSAGYVEHLFGDFSDDLWEIFCVFVSFSGLVVRCATVGFVPGGTSGRNTKKQLAETLNTTGMYSLVRHPLYLGNFLVVIGMALYTQNFWFVIVVALLFWVYYERIIFAEEEFLREKFGEEYLEWANKTPAFIPRLGNWLPPALPFSLRTVLRREYSGLFAIVAVYTFLEFLGDLLEEGRISIDRDWLWFFISGMAIYLLLRTLKKRTKLLHVEGR